MTIKEVCIETVILLVVDYYFFRFFLDRLLAQFSWAHGSAHDAGRTSKLLLGSFQLEQKKRPSCVGSFKIKILELLGVGSVV